MPLTQHELSGIAKPPQLGIAIDDLLKSRSLGAAREFFTDVLLVKACHCIDQADLRSYHRLQFLDPLLEVGSIQHPQRESQYNHRDGDHQRDRDEQDPLLVIRAGFIKH